MVIPANTRCPFVFQCQFAEECYGCEDRNSDFICDLGFLLFENSCPLETE
jgi:hypothetical protein